MAERGTVVQTVNNQEGIAIVDVPAGQRDGLKWILEESFEGWYLRHSIGTLRKIEVVRAAIEFDKPVGLTMVKTLEGRVGYVYYIAVAKNQRRKGIAKLLLDDVIQRFKSSGMREVFASVEKDNEPSEALFTSQGFTQTSFREVSKKHGHLQTLNMYREMLVVPGEVLLRRGLE